MDNKPHALVTNDDGIDSAFLLELVAALLPKFDISVAAPASEQSWIGRAMSRHSELTVQKINQLFPEDVSAWSISGTPSDCVNIALGHLVTKPVDIVLSGINIGFNTTETLILSSGTVAGAIEGGLWELPAIAFSQCVPRAIFAEVSSQNGRSGPDFALNLKSAARHCTRIALDYLEKPGPTGTVLNINFPPTTTDDTLIEDATLAKVRLGSLFAETQPGTYRFQYSDGISHESSAHSDRATLERGAISRTLLDFTKIGQKLP
jgi:5'-nucleotidase